MTIPRQVLLAMAAEAHGAWVLDHEASSDYTHDSVDMEAPGRQLDELHRRIEAAKAGWLATNP